MSKFKIEKNIPLPLRHSEPKHGPYPWADMEVGDSFFVPCADLTEMRTVQIVVLASARGWAKRQENDVKFSTRRLDNGFRVWRVK